MGVPKRWVDADVFLRRCSFITPGGRHLNEAALMKGNVAGVRPESGWVQLKTLGPWAVLAL